MLSMIGEQWRRFVRGWRRLRWLIPGVKGGAERVCPGWPGGSFEGLQRS